MLAVPPSACSRAASPVVTQPSAVPVTELAKPTTVSVRAPAAPLAPVPAAVPVTLLDVVPVTVSLLPSCRPPSPFPGPAPRSSTTWPGPSGQCPAFSTRSSTGPPAEDRPARVSGPYGWPSDCTATVAAANGPAVAVTPPSVLVAASWAGLARSGFTVSVTSAPCWLANACWNGELLAASRLRPSVAEAVEISTTMPIAIAWIWCRRRPPVAVRTGPEPAHAGTSGARWPPAGRRPAATVRAANRWASDRSWVTSTSVCPSRFSSRSTARDLLPGGRVQGPGRLIGQQQLRAVDQGPGDRHPLPLPARHPGRVGVAVLGDPQLGQQLPGPGPGLPPGRPGQLGGQQHVVLDGEVVEQVEELEDDADVPGPEPGQRALAELVDPPPGQADLAGARPVQPGDQVEQGGLAAAGRAHDRHHLPGRHGQVHVQQRGCRARLVGLGHPVQPDHLTGRRDQLGESLRHRDLIKKTKQPEPPGRAVRMASRRSGAQ